MEFDSSLNNLLVLNVFMNFGWNVHENLFVAKLPLVSLTESTSSRCGFHLSQCIKW